MFCGERGAPCSTFSCAYSDNSDRKWSGEAGDWLCDAMTIWMSFRALYLHNNELTSDMPATLGNLAALR
jgi:hypothetical protein